MIFSVIIPIYNVEKYLRECVDSVLEQTFHDYELILVDDGSKDSSGAICDEYAAKHDFIKVVHKQNGGQSSARNIGVKTASGEFIIFLDSDDFISDKNFFEDLKNAITDQTDAVLYKYKKYYSECKVVDSCFSYEGMNTGKISEFWLSVVQKDGFYCAAWTKTIRASVIKCNGIRFDENLRGEDMDWYYQVVAHLKHVSTIDKSYIMYRQRENSVTKANPLKSIADYIYTLDKWSIIFTALEDEVLKRAMFSSLAKLYCNLLIAYSRNTKKLKAFRPDIKRFSYLLDYNDNPRTKQISKFYRFFGLGMTVSALKILDKIKE